MPTLILPVSFKPLTGGETTLSMDGATSVKAMLDQLLMDHPVLTQRLVRERRLPSDASLLAWHRCCPRPCPSPSYESKDHMPVSSVATPAAPGPADQAVQELTQALARRGVRATLDVDDPAVSLRLDSLVHALYLLADVPRCFLALDREVKRALKESAIDATVEVGDAGDGDLWLSVRMATPDDAHRLAASLNSRPAPPCPAAPGCTPVGPDPMPLPRS
ncbi:hypothetical protein [Streptomyces sp. SID1034]|uniref:hypothetical protein n=1 Tax=Streptomyces sp. SID1034 TaxID=2690248 RepID=UPI00136DFF23|nr:hypothetical protein [Streptomyces sp. SID1034]MYV95300.1 hypothetical protein [Streptomyces sp. SID1034]